MSEAPSSVTFHYIKANDFRVVHVDGAIGGITPRGLIHAAIYNERAAIPQTVVNSLNTDGLVGEVMEVNVKPGIVREMQVDLLLDRDAAESLRIWLGEKVAELDAAVSSMPQGKK